MQESVIYQDLLEAAREQARREERLEEARSLILRLLDRRVGELPNSVRAQIAALTITQVESLGEALLDFSELRDLEVWLAEHPGK